jgi:hypothetical protein
MDKKFAFLEYLFLFNPADSWTSLSDFEHDLADFFSAHGLDAEILKTVEGQIGKRILLIKKAEELVPTVIEKKPSDAKSVKPLFDKFRK